jgi:uroporphyrinogen decarboxylase
MKKMTKRERVMAAVKGEPVDRVPASFFGHNHAVEHSSDTLAPHLLQQNQKFDWDFIKVHLRASYYGEAWGCKYRWDPEEGPQLEDYIVRKADDFRKLKKLDPTKGVLGDQIRVAKLLGEALKDSVPYIQTVFCPLTVAGKLAGAIYLTPSEKAVIKQFMKENPEALHQGLTVISQTLADYAREAIRAGADGIFYTTTVWSRDAISEEEYKIFGRPYDLAIFEAAIEEGATFNILHLCRENIMFDLLSDYPVQLINYDALSPRNPSLKAAMSRTDKAIWGGVAQNTTLLNGPAEAIAAEVNAALEQTGGRRFFLGPGCAIPPAVPDTHLLAVKKALASYSRA